MPLCARKLLIGPTVIEGSGDNILLRYLYKDMQIAAPEVPLVVMIAVVAGVCL